MSGHGQKMTRNMELTIAALLANPTIQAAAKSAGVSVASINRWMKLETFRDAYQAARREVVRNAIAHIQAVMAEAVTTLTSVMTDSEAPPSARVSAAKAVLATGLKAAELEDLENRIITLEMHLKQK